MIGIFAALMIAAGTVFAALRGTLAETGPVLLTAAQDTVTLCVSLCGSLCFFSGIGKIAEAAGITKQMARLFSPLFRRLMPLSERSVQAKEAVCMNLSANLFGLGNAATPFGVRASEELYRLGQSEAPTRSLATFVILNTCSVQLIPTTVAALRATHGAKDPFDVLIPILLTQFLCCGLGVLLVRIFFKREK